ncbi:MAG: hypothetical protein IJ692_04230 [Alloprevotella sp.]|nr:hypothetical protein [Alloprevotella sp.]
MAASDEPRTLRELSLRYEARFRALREEGRCVHERYRQHRQWLNRLRRAAGESSEQYRPLFRTLRQQYEDFGRRQAGLRARLQQDFLFERGRIATA